MIALSPSRMARARRLAVRVAAYPRACWPADPRGFYGAAAPLALPLMFDAVDGDAPSYALAGPDGQVALDTGTWAWSAADGSGAGRGLIALWAWRFDVSCAEAHGALAALVTQAEEGAMAREEAARAASMAWEASAVGQAATAALAARRAAIEARRAARPAAMRRAA